jgi:hypothetical protein
MVLDNRLVGQISGEYANYYLVICMEIDKPLVTILLAVYKPNETWFMNS